MKYTGDEMYMDISVLPLGCRLYRRQICKLIYCYCGLGLHVDTTWPCNDGFRQANQRGQESLVYRLDYFPRFIYTK
jgi:hypothetical protein